MPDLSQPAVLERLIFWLRASGVLLLVGGIFAMIAAGYFATRLQQSTSEELERLQSHVQQLESTRARPSGQPATAPVPQGRQITEQQHARLVELLARYEGTHVNVVSLPEFEPGSYAHALIKTLRAAGVDVRVSYFPDSEAIPPGLRAYWSAAAPERAQSILQAFETAGIPVIAKRGTPKGAVLEFHVGKAQSPAAAPDSSAPSSDAVK